VSGGSPGNSVLDVVVKHPAVADRPLVLYAYFETNITRVNLEFFIAHGLHAAADFIFILNGETDAETLIPKKDNIRYVKRNNTCFDVGSYAEVLIKNDLYKGYSKFIMMNASLRGPFFPDWSESCWTDIFLKKITEEVKVCRLLQIAYIS
jgi:hypothetical protein